MREMPELPAFDPAPCRKRHDGWTPERQRLFLAMLQSTASVSAAARAAGMTPKSAYRLRERSDAQSFRAAWDEIVSAGRAIMTDRLTDLALNGRPHAIRYHGRVIAIENRPCMQATETLLRRYDRMANRDETDWRKVTEFDAFSPGDDLCDLSHLEL